MVLGLGMDQALVRFFYESKKTAFRKRLVCYCCGISCAFLGAIVLLSILLFIATGSLFGLHSVELLSLFAIYVLTLIVQRMSFLVIRLQFKTILLSFLNVLQKVLYTCSAVALIVFSSLADDESLMIATTVSIGVTALAAMFAEKKLWNPSGADKTFPFGADELFRYGLPLALASGVSMVFQATDRIALQAYCDLGEIGIYASALNLVNIFAIVQTSFNQLWAPSIVEHYANDPTDTTFYERGYNIIFIAMFVFGATLIYAKELIAILLGEQYREAAFMLPFLAFHPMMYTISEASSVGISLKKKSKYQVYVSIASCILNIVGCITLVPLFGTYGAAFSTGMSYVLFFALRTAFAQRLLPININLSRTVILIIVMIAFATYSTLHSSFEPASLVIYLFVMGLSIVMFRKTIAREAATVIAKIKRGRGSL